MKNILAIITVSLITLNVRVYASEGSMSFRSRTGWTESLLVSAKSNCLSGLGNVATDQAADYCTCFTHEVAAKFTTQQFVDASRSRAGQAYQAIETLASSCLSSAGITD
jgi:hypothetical protein